MEPIDDESCTLVSGSNSFDELAVWVASLGVEFEIHEPAALVPHLRELAGRLVRAAARERRV